MGNKGWIKLHRSLLDHWIHERDKDGTYQMEHYWIDMLLMTNHEDRKIPCNKKVITIKAGSFMTSLRKLGSRWGMDKDSVRTILETFENEKMITRKTENNATVITIVNYGLYQSSKGKNTDTDSDTISDTDSDTLSDTISDAITDTWGDTDSTQTRMNKNDYKNDITTKKKMPVGTYSIFGGEPE